MDSNQPHTPVFSSTNTEVHNPKNNSDTSSDEYNNDYGSHYTVQDLTYNEVTQECDRLRLLFIDNDYKFNAEHITLMTTKEADSKTSAAEKIIDSYVEKEAKRYECIDTASRTTVKDNIEKKFPYPSLFESITATSYRYIDITDITMYKNIHNIHEKLFKLPVFKNLDIDFSNKGVITNTHKDLFSQIVHGLIADTCFRSSRTRKTEALYQLLKVLSEEYECITKHPNVNIFVNMRSLGDFFSVFSTLKYRIKVNDNDKNNIKIKLEMPVYNSPQNNTNYVYVRDSAEVTSLSTGLVYTIRPQYIDSLSIADFLSKKDIEHGRKYYRLYIDKLEESAKEGETNQNITQEAVNKAIEQIKDLPYMFHNIPITALKNLEPTHSCVNSHSNQILNQKREIQIEGFKFINISLSGTQKNKNIKEPIHENKILDLQQKPTYTFTDQVVETIRFSLNKYLYHKSSEEDSKYHFGKKIFAAVEPMLGRTKQYTIQKIPSRNNEEEEGSIEDTGNLNINTDVIKFDYIRKQKGKTLQKISFELPKKNNTRDYKLAYSAFLTWLYINDNKKDFDLYNINYTQVNNILIRSIVDNVLYKYQVKST